jgi:hypothetical protein
MKARKADFRDEIIQKLAAVVLERAYSVDNRNGASYHQCVYCSAAVPWARTTDNIQHDPNCIVLEAKRALHLLGFDYGLSKVG